MSFNNVTDFAESMPLSRVVQELRTRGLNVEAPDRELRSELARAICAENGVYVPRGSAPGYGAESGLAGVAGEVGRHQSEGLDSERPPAESTRLNGDFRSSGAIPRRQGQNQSAMAGGNAATGHNNPASTSLPPSFRNAYLGKYNNFRLGGASGNQTPAAELYGPRPENFDLDDEDLPGESGEHFFKERYEQLPSARAHRARALQAGSLRARFAPDQAPIFHQPIGPYFEEEEPPAYGDVAIRPENNAQRQRRISTAFDSLRKLNIKFSGAQNEDPDEFIKSLKEGRHILQLADEELLQCVPFLLTGVARNWYRTTGAGWRSFREFEQAWFMRFTNPDFQYALKEEIRARTQHPRERVTDFLTNLKCLLERLRPPMPERDQIREAMRNMLPALSLPLNVAIGLNQGATWVDLERAAANMERSMFHAKQYKPPPSVDESMLPSLAYKDSGRPYRPKPIRVNAVEEEEAIDDLMLGLDDFMPDEELAHLRYRSNANTTPGSRSGPERPKVEGRCWRCGEKGHFMDGCKNPRRVFCRDCGKYGVRRTNCPVCPPIREQTFCTRCGLIGPTTEECECSRSEN